MEVVHAPVTVDIAWAGLDGESAEQRKKLTLQWSGPWS